MICAGCDGLVGTAAGADALDAAGGAEAGGAGAAADCNTEVSADAERVSLAVRCSTAQNTAAVERAHYHFHNE